MNSNTLYDGITIGTVVDTNDPQQMGRIRVICAAWNESLEQSPDSVPWAMYCTPFGGHTTEYERGSDDNTTPGGVAYGMWAIPKIGANVVISCIDGNPSKRIWMGCVYSQHTPHTLPHGRFVTDSDKLDGPLSSAEQPIQPLHVNTQTACGGDISFPEAVSRFGDYSVSALDINNLKQNSDSSVPDTKEGVLNNVSITQGYANTRLAAISDIFQYEENIKLDPSITSMTTPGFHSMSMDDRIDNSRIRFRTSTGHQMIFDDTNERIYINTAKGDTWIQLDQDGNIDIFAAKKISIRSNTDINLTADKTVRIMGKEGIHLNSDEGEIRMQCNKSLHIKSNEDVNVLSSKELKITSEKDLHISANANILLTGGENLNLKGNINTNLEAGISGSIKVGGMLKMTGPAIHFNGPPASPADDASPAEPEDTFFTNRVPDHEPYIRTSTADDFSHTPKVTDGDSSIGSEDSTRNGFWRR